MLYTRQLKSMIYQMRQTRGVLKDEEIVLCYGENKKKEHLVRRIAYWDSANERLFEFVTNNFDLSAEKIAIL